MSFLSSLRPVLIGTGIGLSLLLPSSPLRAAPVQCQYTAPYYNQHASPESGWSVESSGIASKQGQTGVSGSGGNSTHPGTGLLNARYMRQISLGSVLGLATGLGLRVFSKALVFFLGVSIVLIEWAASKGYNIVPVNTLQRYVKGFDLQRVTRENVPFKVSFGSTMAFAAFGSFADYS